MRTRFAGVLLSGAAFVQVAAAQPTPCEIVLSRAADVVVLEALVVDDSWLGADFGLDVDVVAGSSRSRSIQQGAVLREAPETGPVSLARLSSSLPPGGALHATLTLHKAGRAATCERSFRR